MKPLSITDIDAAWAAGFLDGEGSFSIHKSNTRAPYYYCRICATQIVSGPLSKLQWLFGGNIHLRNNTKYSLSSNHLYVWSLSGNKKLVPVLEALLPHLVLKQEEGKIMYDYVTTVLAEQPYQTKGIRGSLPMREEYRLYREQAYNAIRAARTDRM